MVRTNKTLLILWLFFCNFISSTGCDRDNQENISGLYLLESDQDDSVHILNNGNFIHTYKHKNSDKLFKNKGVWEVSPDGSRIEFDTFTFHTGESGLWSVEIENCGFLIKKCFCYFDRDENTDCYIRK